MHPPLVRASEAITLVGGGPVPADRIRAALQRAPVLVAADGGADRARALGHLPDAIIGDLDSLSNHEWWRKSGISVHRIPEQDSTDFEKCLRATEAPLILAVGFLGGRFDHALAVASALVAYRARPVLVLGEEDVIFHCPEVLALELPAGARVSFFPLGEIRGTESAGLRWSVEGLAMRPGGVIGTSNEAVGGPVRAAFDAPGILVILPVDHLDAAIGAVTRAPDPSSS
ncbi:MAG: thiamine diphosphokinase [Pseudomonadota bacterium]